MAKYPYLTRSPKKGIWRYRRGVPELLRPIVGKREIVKSFGSVEQDEILAQYHAFAAEADQVIDSAELHYELRGYAEAPDHETWQKMMEADKKERSSSPSHLCLAPDDLATTCVQHYYWVQNAELAIRRQTTERAMADPAAFWRGEILPLPMSQEEFYALPQFAHLAGTDEGCAHLLAMAYAKRIEDIAVFLRAKLATQDVGAVAGYYGSCRDCALQFGLAMVATELQAVNDLLTKDVALVPVPATPQVRDVARSGSAPRRSDGPKLSEAVQLWVEAASKGKSAWSSERRALCERVMADFIEVCGDKGVGDYKKSDGREFVQLLRRLPPNLEKRRSALGLGAGGLREIADAAERKCIPPQDDNNTNKKIGIVHQCFSWMTTRFDECGASPVQGMKIAIKRSAKEEKDPFTIEQLNAIFAAPIYRGCQSEREWSRPGQLVLWQSAKFWVPLIALFSGMRSGEICQLTRQHIRLHEGVHYFALTHDLRLKNDASIRSVPMHDTLIRCGFLDFVSSRDGLLFPELTQHASGRWSDAFGKHFARFMKSIGAQSDKTDFHSFRHTFVAAADACGVEFATRERLLGHVLHGQAGRYGKSYKQEQADMQLLLARGRQLQVVAYPGLELSHLEPG